MTKKQKLVMDDPWGKTPIVYIEKVYYEKPRNMGLRLYCEDGPYCTLTINTGKKCEEGYSFVDSTYGPFNEWFVEGYELGEPTGRIAFYGGNPHEEYRFDMEKLAQYM